MVVTKAGDAKRSRDLRATRNSGGAEAPGTNGYQRAKARKIADYLQSCRAHSTLTPHQLCQAVAIMSFEQWRTVSFSAGVPVADLSAKAAVLAMLREAVHAA